MAAKRQSFLDKLEKERPELPATASAPTARATTPKTRTGPLKTSIYIPDHVHDRLREIAFAERRKVHDLLMEGIDRVIEDRGHSERTAGRKTS